MVADVGVKTEEKQLKMLNMDWNKINLFVLFICTKATGGKSYCFQRQYKQDDCRRQEECHREKLLFFCLALALRVRREMQREHLLKHLQWESESVCCGTKGILCRGSTMKIHHKISSCWAGIQPHLNNCSDSFTWNGVLRSCPWSWSAPDTVQTFFRFTCRSAFSSTSH